MASLNKLAIRGIRSFDDKNIAVIEFFSPVTVIVGHNGSGKTTIIECLKYATTGDQPPNSRGGAFVHDPKMANEKEVKAQVKLRFVAANGQRMLAVRNLSVTMKKTAGLTMKTLESILSLADGNPNGKRATISTKCAEIDTEIPNLLGVSKAVLENVIFCHQEESYWPLAEPAALKKKFDDIFEATRYTKALDSIKALRKERVADLKVDKEKLESLAKEKAHADKLKKRLQEMQSSINSKAKSHEELRKDCDQLIAANKHFYESATKFRERFIEIQHLEDENKRYNAELKDAKIHVKEMMETDEELAERRKNFDRYKTDAEKKHGEQMTLLKDTIKELERLQRSLLGLRQEKGKLEAEAKKHEHDVEERDKEVYRIVERFQFRDFVAPPYTREQLIHFRQQMDELLRRSLTDLEALEKDVSDKLRGYTHEQNKLQTDQKLLEQKRESLQKRINDLQSTIPGSESEFVAGQSLPRELSAVRADMKDKKSCIEKIKEDIKLAKYDEAIQNATNQIRALEEDRETLNMELKNLTLQADSRAKLDINRADLSKKRRELQDILDSNAMRFKAIIGSEIEVQSMENEVDKTTSAKEKDRSEAETHFNNANASAKHSEVNIATLSRQLKAKSAELKDLDAMVSSHLGEHSSIEEAIKEAEEELELRRNHTSSFVEKKQLYELFLDEGRKLKKCTVCNRGLNDHDMHEFERNLSEQIRKQSPDEQENLKDEAEAWETELNELRGLLPAELSRITLKQQGIPSIQKDLQQEESNLPDLIAAKDEAYKNLNGIQNDLKELQTLKQQSVALNGAKSTIARLEKDITRLEESLTSTGSVKTADSVQEELNDLRLKIQKLENDRAALQNDREQQINLLRRQQDDLTSITLQENELFHRVQERDTLEKKINFLHLEAKEAIEKVKKLDEGMKSALEPLGRIQREHDSYKERMDDAIRQKREQYEEARRSADSLAKSNRDIELYVRSKRGRLLENCETDITETEDRIKNQDRSIEEVRKVIGRCEKEIHESDSFLSNLRENERIRRLQKSMEENKAKIDSFDMEEAAKARRQFDDKYASEKKREGDMEAEYSRLGGELSSLKAQLKIAESDLSEFKTIHKQYTDQLIKVKMSDMANNDLEKYAKALDNAIMKYHSLKMEEVNDTMRHLWNKTYQGTDIDGIRIRSDAEGGASKRSYNYRVVMTKDQVEMDMRGRCSAGQKMLASIIIRLALSDSFGQNCGILALDEPTNALDVDNIDALAGSLVDIINERKNHANFQLIIITHDENFLRKLEQANVMEYYWRVSRDPRQKSIIERQRVG